MKNQALYQKYRSHTFEEVVGQEYIVQSIQNAIQQDKIGHAYLFCGPRGTGKTTMARILAQAVNCEHPESAPCGTCENCKAAKEGNHPDIIEINAANETHVEDIRDLIERARLAPMMGKKKIYIVDEVHQLSSSAASALLKTLEEPPEHVIFVLATTDPQKLLKTIISRCQRFDFSKVPTGKIKEHLQMIAQNENMKLEPEAALKIAQLADGGMRDALSMLEQASSYGNGTIQEKDIDAIYGLTSTEEKLELIKALCKNDFAQLLDRISQYEARGIDITRLTSDLIDALKDSVIYASTNNESLLRTIGKEQAKQLNELLNPKEALNMVEEFMKARELYKGAQSAVNIFEVACMKMMVKEPTTSKPEIQKEVVKETKAEPKEEKVETKETSVQEPEVLIEELVYEEVPQPVVQKEPEPVKKKSKEKVDIEKMLGLLVQCDKESKAEDNEKLNTLLSGVVSDRYIAALKQAKLMASGKDCLVLVTTSKAAANHINERTMNEELYNYLIEHAQIDKMIYALSDAEYTEVIEAYKARRTSGDLPEATKIERYQTIEKKGDTPNTEEKLQELFGKEGILKVYD